MEQESSQCAICGEHLQAVRPGKWQHTGECKPPLALPAPDGDASQPAPTSPPSTPPSPKRYTGEILLRTRPKTYRRVIQLLGEGVPAVQIMRLCRVSQGMVDAMALRHAATVDARKNEIVTLLTDVSHIGSARMMDTIGKASLRDASIGTGIAIQRSLELLGQSTGVQVAVVNMPSEADREAQRSIDAKLDAIAKRLASAPASTDNPPPAT